jgi:hypothetical protein
MPEPQAHLARPPGGPGPPAPPATGDPGRGPDPADPGPAIPVRLGDRLIGDLGAPNVDARLLGAILLRDGRVAAWLRGEGVDVADVERAFPGGRW